MYPDLPCKRGCILLPNCKKNWTYWLKILKIKKNQNIFLPNSKIQRPVILFKHECFSDLLTVFLMWSLFLRNMRNLAYIG